MTTRASSEKSSLTKLATTAIGIALMINDRRKRSSKKLVESTQRTSADLIKRGTEVDQQLRQSTHQLIEQAQLRLEQQLKLEQKITSGKSSIRDVQQSIEQAADQGRDRILALSGVATHKDVKDNAKLSHLNALSNQVAVFNDQVSYQFKQQVNELAQKADKFDLAPLARSVELTHLAKTEDLSPLATSEELARLATKADLELLAQIPILTDKVDLLASREDLTPLAKESSLQATQTVLANQMETHHSRIELLMAQLATRDDLRKISHEQLTKRDIESATSLLASREDVESVVKQLIKHIHHLERQVMYLKERIPNMPPQTAEKEQTTAKSANTSTPSVSKSISDDKKVSESINSVQVRAH